MKSSNFLAPVHDSSLYLSEKDRFAGSFVEQERVRREIKLQQKKSDIERRRLLQESITKQRQENEAELCRKHEIKMHNLQAKGSPKNERSLPYNPVSLEYDATNQGKLLKFEDDKIKFRSKQRAKKLYFEQNRNGYNPITGKKYKSIKLPPPPVKPKLNSKD